MIEIVQTQGNKLNLAFALSLAVGACVRACLVRPPHAPSLRRCPQLSTLVRDHRGKSLCSREVGCLAKCPHPTQAARLGGRAHGGSGGTFPFSDRGARSVELSLDLRRSGGNQVVPHSLTHSLTHSQKSPSVVFTALAQPWYEKHVAWRCIEPPSVFCSAHYPCMIIPRVKACMSSQLASLFLLYRSAE